MHVDRQVSSHGNAPDAGTIRFAGHGGDSIQGFLARPRGTSLLSDGRFPALVVVQEAFGVDAHIHSMTSRFASEGFVALAPDLYSREGVPGPIEDRTTGEPAAAWTVDQIRSAVASLPDRRVLGDLEGALAHLALDPGVDPERLGAVGFCMGGNYALLLGCKSTRLAAVVDFYGRFVYPELSKTKPIQPLEMALNLSAPLLAMFGEQDPSISRDDIERMRSVLTQFARDFRIEVFPGVGHGFMNDRRASYDPRTAEQGWRLAIEFLREHLLEAVS